MKDAVETFKAVTRFRLSSLGTKRSQEMQASRRCRWQKMAYRHGGRDDPNGSTCISPMMFFPTADTCLPKRNEGALAGL